MHHSEPDICQQIDLNQIRQIHNNNFYSSKGDSNNYQRDYNQPTIESHFQNNDNLVIYEE